MCRLDSVQVAEAPTLYLWAYASVILSVYLIRPTTDGDDAPFFYYSELELPTYIFRGKKEENFS